MGERRNRRTVVARRDEKNDEKEDQKEEDCEM